MRPTQPVLVNFNIAVAVAANPYLFLQRVIEHKLLPPERPSYEPHLELLAIVLLDEVESHVAGAKAHYLV